MQKLDLVTDLKSYNAKHSYSALLLLKKLDSNWLKSFEVKFWKDF